MASISTIIFAIVFVVIGLIGAYSGYKVFKMYLAFIGFVAGFMIGINLFGQTSILAILVAIFIGLIIAGLSYVFYKIALFIAFAFIGANIASSLFGGFNDEQGSKIVGGIIGVGIALVLMVLEVDKPAIIIITSLIGAYFIVIGVASVVQNSILNPSFGIDLTLSLNDLQKLNAVALRAVDLITSSLKFSLIFLFFAVTGIFFQFKNWLNK